MPPRPCSWWRGGRQSYGNTDKIHRQAPAPADPCGSWHYLFVLRHDAHGRQRRRHGTVWGQGGRGPGDHGRQAGGAGPGPALSHSVRLLAEGSADGRHGHQLRLREGCLPYLCIQAAGDLAADGAVHHRNSGDLHSPGHLGGGEAEPVHGLFPPGFQLPGKQPAQLFRGPASHAAVLHPVEAAAGDLQGHNGAKRHPAHPDSGHCHVRQVYAAGPGHGAGGAEQGLCLGGQGQRRAGKRHPVEKRPQVLHADHYHPSGPVHRQLAWGHRHY